MSEQNLPAGKAPPGVEVNMENPPSNGYILVTVSSILLAIMLGFVMNRFYTKVYIARKFSWDDGQPREPSPRSNID